MQILPHRLPGKASKQACDPRSMVHTPFFTVVCPSHLHAYTRTHAVVLVFVAAQVLLGEKKKKTIRMEKKGGMK